MDAKRLGKYFEDSGENLIKVLHNKRQDYYEICRICDNPIDEEDVSVLCAACIYQCHLRCTSLRHKPKKIWFCKACHDLVK